MTDTMTRPSHGFTERLHDQLVQVLYEDATPLAAPPRGRRRRWRVAAAVAAAAVAAAVLAIGPGALAPPERAATAFAVERLPDGRIQVSTTEDFADPAGLERRLRELGVRVRVRAVVTPRPTEVGRVVTMPFPVDGTDDQHERLADAVSWDQAGRTETIDFRKLPAGVELWVGVASCPDDPPLLGPLPACLDNRN